MQELGVDRVVLARENTLEDIRAINAAVPELGLESFIHGALCIAYSGQCFMSGMISERSANRGSCAQSCRKDYVLTDAASGEELDRGYLISAKDLGAYDHLQEIADAGDRLPEDRGPQEEARIRRDRYQGLSRFSRPRREGRRHARRRPRKSSRSCRSSAAASLAGCTAAARDATTSRARSRTITATSSARSSDTTAASSSSTCHRRSNRATDLDSKRRGRTADRRWALRVARCAPSARGTSLRRRSRLACAFTSAGGSCAPRTPRCSDTRARASASLKGEFRASGRASTFVSSARTGRRSRRFSAPTTSVTVAAK